MKTMKKTIIIILSLVLILCAASCGDKEQEVTVNAMDEYYGFYLMENGFLALYDDGTFDLLDLEGNVYDSGTGYADDGITLTYADGETDFFVLDGEGNLYGGEDIGTLLRIDPNDESYGLAAYLDEINSQSDEQEEAKG